MILPTLAAMAILAVGIGSVLHYSTSRSDTLAVERQTHLIRLALQQSVAQIANDQEASTLWDDAVARVRQRPLDYTWIDNNLGIWFHTYYGHDEVYLLDPANQPLYAMQAGRRAPPETFGRVSAQALPLVDELRSALRFSPEAHADNGGHTPGAWNVALVAGRPAIVSVKPIVPETAGREAPAEPAYLHISIRYLDRTFLRDLARDFGVEGARFNSQPVGEASLPIRNRAEQTIGYLVWSPFEPGEQVESRMVPVLWLAVLLIGALLAWLLHRTWARARQERELLELTFENVTQGILLVDPELRLELWNKPFCDMLGLASKDMTTGRDVRELIMINARRGEVGAGEPGELVAQIAASILRGEEQRAEVLRGDGTILELFGRTISGGRYLIIVRDVTDERNAARLKEELVSTVSHELRTPLTAIAGALGLMTGSPAEALPPRAAKLAQLAMRNCERLIALVNDLLDMDKLASGTAEFAFADIDLRELVDDAVEQNQTFAERFGVTLAAELPSEPVRASVDARRIQQVLANLLSNAAKFSPRGTQATISLQKQGPKARITVVDEGPGIAPEFRHRLFTRFAQQDATSQRAQTGTGLGLAITRAIVERHGGCIWLDPDVKRGAAFHVELPTTRD